MKCQNCNKETSNPRFCCRSCSAQVTNKESPKRFKEVKYSSKPCLTCKKIYEGRDNSLYCSLPCHNKHKSLKKIERWKNDGIIWGGVKKYLLDQQEGKCNSCGIKDWNGKPLVLHLEHIDGNCDNNAEENIELICPNCHSQTSTYAGRNTGRYKSKRNKYLTARYHKVKDEII